MFQRNSVIIPFDVHGKSNWSLIITRDNNSDSLYFALHWGNKVEPTHLGIEKIADFNKAMLPLFDEQVTT